MAQNQKREQKPQTRQICPGVTLVGWRSVERWDDEVRRAATAPKEENYSKEVEFTPDFETP